MVLLACAGLLAAAWQAAAAAETSVGGYVFADRCGDGEFDVGAAASRACPCW